MKITKILKIKSHRIFRDFSWPGDLPEFSRYNVIYGWNGSGKTTLSSLLSCIERHEPVSEGQVEIELDNHTTVAGPTFATASLPNIRVFNRDFIARTIAAIQNGNIEPISVFIGEKKVEDIKRLNEEKINLEECNEKLSNIRDELSAADKAMLSFLTKGAKAVKDGLLQFNASQYANYNRQHFEMMLRDIQHQPCVIVPLDDQTVRELQTKASQQSKAQISFPPPDLPNLDLLRAQVCEILGESVVSKTIEELVHDPQLSEWVQTGLRLHSGENHSDICHFCGNPISATRIEQLEAHFNDSVKTIQQKIGNLLNGIEQHQTRLSEIINRLPHPSQFYEDLSTQCEKICSRIKTGSLNLHGRLQLYAEHLRRKRENLFQCQTCDIQKTDDDAVLLPMKTAFIDLGDLIHRHADKTNTLADDCRTATKKLEKNLVLRWLEEYNEQHLEIDEKLKEKAMLQSKHLQLSQTINSLELSLVEKSKAADELNKDLQDYLGRNEISFSVIDGQIGYKLLRDGQPATHLSEGELSAIAFLYFLRSLTDRTFNLETGVIVIDDPVSSLDSTALYSAFSFMKSRIEKGGQMIILTHNFVFLKNITTWFHYLQRQKKQKQEVRYYGLKCIEANGKRTSSIAILDPLLNEFDSEYHYLFKCLYECANASTQQSSLSSLYEIPNIARRVLEVFLAYQWPTKQTMLSGQLSDVPYDPAKKTRIGRLLNACSHGGGIQGPEHDLSALNEAKTAIRDVLDLIKHFNPSHFEGMEKMIKRP